MQESKTLRTLGIGMTILGTLGTLFSAFILAVMVSVSYEDGDRLNPAGVAIFSGWVIMCLSYLVAGIIAMKNWKKPERIQICCVTGMVLIALAVVSAGVSMVISDLSAARLMIMSLLLPVWYTCLACQIKKHGV